ncbi:TraR/DksA family transcriptional regulator [Pseudomonas sp. C27(2019)]|uniref:TraR/DksA family transcriptional regulator n=1 Tax=Pseudomonas sp. C27(2019) TaxID=2604941 RepID=UPI0012453A2F|nr:TraR/DksA family transcriptional regulator [Pseudomonas sp. C27(2019)]QEY59692.1 TraR/DksA family transcriptional regulator [Pseudomonas sp. C27(2019)]
MAELDPRVRLQALLTEYSTRAEAIERDLSREHAQSFSEQATERQNDMVLQGLLADARMGVQEVKQALERLDAGTYGECEKCGEPINEARLEALPTAQHCINCAD